MSVLALAGRFLSMIVFMVAIKTSAPWVEVLGTGFAAVFWTWANFIEQIATEDRWTKEDRWARENSDDTHQ